MPDDGSYCQRQVLADVPGAGASALGVKRPVVGLPSTDDAPSSLRGQVEAKQLMVALRDFLCDSTIPELLGQSLDLVVEHIREALEKEKG